MENVNPDRRAWLRGILAGPLALLAACLTMTAGAIWLPPGDAGVNNLVLPVVLFPLLWTGFFLYACLDRHLQRAFTVIGLVMMVNGLLLTWHLFK